MARDNGIWLLLIYLVLSIYLLPIISYGGAARELTLWAAAASLVENRSFDISWAEPLIGSKAETTTVGDHNYSNEAPGTIILAATVYALTRVFSGPPDESNIRISLFVMRFFLSTLPLLLLAVWLYARETDEISLAALLFATPLFVYSLLFLPNIFVAVVLYFAFRFIYDQRYVMPWHGAIGGALCGLAVASGYAAVIPTAVFLIGLLFTDKRERLRRPLFFVFGIAPFVLLIAWFNYSLFGSSLPAISIGRPSLYRLYLLLISPSSGLFFTAPILLFSLVTLFTSPEARTVRHRIKWLAIIATVVVVSGMPTEKWAFGASYLVIIIPLLLDSFFDGEIYEMSNLWQGLWFGLSIILCILPGLTTPLAPSDIAYPHRNYWLRSLRQDHIYSPNLANAFGAPNSWWTLIPVFVLILVAVYLIMRNMRRPKRFGAGLITAAAVIGLYLFIP